MTTWTRDYVGLPRLVAGRSRAGVDCYGLIWLVYRDVLRLELASYAGETLDAPERGQIAALVAGGCAASPWCEIRPGAEREFDMAVFRRGGIADHVGLVVSRGRMLHVLDETGVYLESFAEGRWKNRLAGIYRHEGFVMGALA